MKIHERFAEGRPVVSFEFFPPKTDAGFTTLFRTYTLVQADVSSRTTRSPPSLGMRRYYGDCSDLL